LTAAWSPQRSIDSKSRTARQDAADQVADIEELGALVMDSQKYLFVIDQGETDSMEPNVMVLTMSQVDTQEQQAGVVGDRERQDQTNSDSAHGNTPWQTKVYESVDWQDNDSIHLHVRVELLPVQV